MAEIKNDSLTVTSKLVVKKIGLAARRQEVSELLKDFDALKYPERIGIIFDNSGSMAGNPIEQAKKATDEFLKVCNPQTTCVAIYSFAEKVLPLTNLFAILSVEKEAFKADYGTPLYSTLYTLLNQEAITRAVVFSDGSPTDSNPLNTLTPFSELKDPNISSTVDVIQKYIDAKIPIDTVFIGHYESTAGLLQDISAKTGGVFLHFKEGSIFSEAFKYLAPSFRAMLTNPEIKARIEKGEKF